MKWALEDASLNMNDVDYLNPHATSTPKGDESEMKAVASLFGDHTKKLLISATKSSIGHMLGQPVQLRRSSVLKFSRKGWCRQQSIHKILTLNCLPD
jgi:hypothetical protein